jgi:hypothetical protein
VGAFVARDFVGSIETGKYAAHAATVAVDPDTGAVDLLDDVVVEGLGVELLVSPVTPRRVVEAIRAAGGKRSRGPAGE